MIPAFVDSSRRAASKILFRGRDLGFWLERSFPFCRFCDSPFHGRNVAFIFDGGSFPVLGAAGARELQRCLRGLDADANICLAPAGKPFFIVSPAFLKRNGISLKPGIFARLRALPGSRTLGLKEPVTILDPRRDLLALEAVVTTLQADFLRQRGVRVENFGNLCLEGLPAIGRGSLLGSGVVVRGDCRIGRNVVLYPNCFIENSRIGDGCVVLPGSVIRDSVVEKEVQLGPYCHLRNGSLVRRGAKMGNFVEMKKSVLGRGSKAMHLSYIGDATVGRKVNIGAGTITCNYDGRKKNPTRIGDNVFIGSGTELVAPITIHSDSYVGAGSTLTEDVPRHALALARQRQKNIAGWVLRKKKK
jgi:acetyltransferase-like isoleucine patch superfamily enzyme